MQEKGLKKSDAFMFVIDWYNKERLSGSISPDEYIPPNVQDALSRIKRNCGYIQFVDEGFYCLEKMVTTKKKQPLGIEPNEVIILCEACQMGKRDKMQTELDKERRKETVKKVMDFAKQFMIITEKGFIATTYMCKCNALEGELIFSRDGKTLVCELNDRDIVDIPKTCMVYINPDDAKPPCQYLMTLDYLATITKEDLEKMKLNIPTITYNEPPVNHDKLYPTKEQIEPEYEIKMDLEDSDKELKG